MIYTIHDYSRPLIGIPGLAGLFGGGPVVRRTRAYQSSLSESLQMKLARNRVLAESETIKKARLKRERKLHKFIANHYARK
jgi:hypothetical protein